MVLSGQAEAFFARVREGLDAAGVAYDLDPHLVRGMDYYRHTAFEFVTDKLGAQGTVLGGGRYDGLIEDMGGPNTPAVGWAAGIERLAMLSEDSFVQRPSLVLVPDSPGEEALARRYLHTLRSRGLSAEMAFSGNAKRRVERARSVDPDAILFVRKRGHEMGDEYMKQGGSMSVNTMDALAARVSIVLGLNTPIAWSR